MQNNLHAILTRVAVSFLLVIGSASAVAQELQKEGYNTALVGKWHLASEPVGFDYYKYHVSRGQQGFYWDPVYNDNGTEKKELGYATNLTTDFALEWLNNRSDNDEPFCLLLQFKAPHREWSPDKKYEELWENVELPYPITFNDDYATRELTAGNTEMTMDYFCREDMKLIPPDSLNKNETRKWLSYGFKRNEIVKLDENVSSHENKKLRFQKYIKDYLATIKSVDDNIGKVLDYLNEKNLDKNTIVIYASDQGFFIGEHGWFDKRFMYEESIRMPFIIKYPGKIKPNTINEDIITNIDFAPTILDIAGINIPVSVQGNSFLNNLTENKNENWRQSMYYHYYEYPFYHHVQPHYGIRNKRYKLMAKKTHVKVRLVPEAKPDSPFFYYVKKPAGGEKAKVKLKARKYNPSTRKHEIFVEKKLPPHSK